MPRKILVFVSIFLAHAAFGAAKRHTVVFGKWTTVKWFANENEDKPLDLKIRALYIDGKVKEYTLDTPHEVTDRLFVVRRAFPLNDALPEDKGPGPLWLWQRGGWLLVDRTAGHVSQIFLPEFDSYYSVASWYRDYVAYCGVSDDEEKSYLMVAQLGRRRPVLRKPTGTTVASDEPDSACPAPNWQRQPMRVTFTNQEGKSTYQVRGHAVDLVKEQDDEDAGTD
jgi:hypothetical protein